MLIPSIDLKGGAVVQLVQGEKLAIRDEDVFRWVRRFEKFPKVQVIDLDAAMGLGDNLALVRQIAGTLACRVGGGIRTVERANDVHHSRSAADHRRVLAVQERRARPRVRADAVRRRRPRSRDRRRGQPRRPGRDSRLEDDAAADRGGGGPGARAVSATSSSIPTSIREGLMGGTDLEAIRAVRDATSRRVTAAGGITTQQEIDDLHALGVDAVVGMAIYTGTLNFELELEL